MKEIVHPQIDDNPDSYGSKGQSWNPTFVEYMKWIVLHPNFEGMPDAIKDDGKIQWEAPSNRSGGQYKDSHHKRRDWWRKKAKDLGISDAEDQWISRVAKAIHPTGEKPCKRCGQLLRIAYVYPSGFFIKRAIKLFGKDLAPDSLEDITAYLRRIVDIQGVDATNLFPALLKTSSIVPPSHGRDLDAWLEWIESSYIPSEPSLLSPGVMSNAPDRFDGFHSFNRCCRGEADTGRHAENMKSYTTDRRVFEYWSEGDWIAADRMMGLVRAKFSTHPNADGGEGSPSADHIGPLSLGFTHRPEFRLLSKAANSAKNNRMTFFDVNYLIKREAEGERVASWHAQPIWNALKGHVHNEETALRLSKVMRDNQRQAMLFLAQLNTKGYATFLASLLDLKCADFNIEFDDLRIVDFVTTYSHILKSKRQTKYSSEQKSRRIRIGFEALRSYAEKSNRHFKPITSPEINNNLKLAATALSKSTGEIQAMDQALNAILNKPGSPSIDEQLRAICNQIPRTDTNVAFADAVKHLKSAMEGVATLLSAMWDDERYIRAEFNFDSD